MMMMMMMGSTPNVWPSSKTWQVLPTLIMGPKCSKRILTASLNLCDADEIEGMAAS